MPKKNKTVKKTVKKSNNIKKPVRTAILSVLLIILMIIVVHDLRKNAIEDIADNKILSMEGQIVKTQMDIIKKSSEVKSLGGKKTETKSGSYPQTDIRFDKCSVFNSFSKEDWYQKFWDKAKELEFTPYSVSSACLSKNANMFIAIAQKGLNCEGPQIYKFNTKSYEMEQAKVTDKGKVCMGSLDAFGKRAGDVIKLEGKSSNKNCSYEDSFDYNFSQNTITLTKSRSLCKDTGAKTTEYNN
jgi:hypothetical protein